MSSLHINTTINNPLATNDTKGLKWENPQPWHESVDASALLNDLRDVFTRYVVLPKFAPEMLALWTVHTYAWQLRDVTTYVGVSSPEKRCGKTTLLGVLSALVQRPLASANISPPALFRVIEEAAPTLLIDEADTFLHEHDEMRGILNAGYTRQTAYVVRVSNQTASVQGRARKQPAASHKAAAPHQALPPENAAATVHPSPDELPQITNHDHSRLHRFSCWCPKVMAAIGRLPETLADRCILIRMQRKTAREECSRLKDLDGAVLRRKCLRLVQDRCAHISAARPEIPKGLNDRAADIWEPLLAIAEFAGDDWTLLAWEAAKALSGTIAESNVIGLLLIHISILFDRDSSNRIFSRDLVAKLNAFPNRPWAEGQKNDIIDELWLSRQLRRYGVRPKSLWKQGTVARGYLWEDLADVFRRYVTRADLEEVKGKQEPESSRAVPDGLIPARKHSGLAGP